MTQLEIAQDLGYAALTQEIEQLAKDVARMLGEKWREAAFQGNGISEEDFNVGHSCKV
jgi:hypothetical protein